MEIYGLKIFYEGQLVHNFRPCVVNGVAGMYNTESNEFFKVEGAEIPKQTKSECNCWRCTAEKLFNAKRVSYMRVGKVYLYQMYSESFEEFETLEEAKQFRNYADENIPYWDYDPVSTIDLNDEEQVMRCKYRGLIRD